MGRAKSSCTYVLKWQRLGWKPEKGSIFNTGPYGEPPLKIKILKIGLRSDLRWPKLGLEPNFMTLGVLVALENVNKVLSDIQRIFNTVPYGDPLENQNFETRFSAC